MSETGHPAPDASGKTSAHMHLAAAHASNDMRESRWLLLPLGLLLCVAGLIAADLAVDYRSGTTVGHVTLEASAMVLGLGGAGLLWRQLIAARRRAISVASDLARAESEAARWRAEAADVLRGLRAAIDQQFGRWELTSAEREIGFYLLNGLSLKAIADLRGTSERTVRQQALAIYRKSGLGGRAELAAFFLEDLLVDDEGAAKR